VHWDLVYDLAEDADYVKGVQKATFTTKDFGLLADPALFANARVVGGNRPRRAGDTLGRGSDFESLLGEHG
jgi:hypothetical protein